MKNQFVKIITKNGVIVWLNTSQIVAVTDNDEDDNIPFVIHTNAVDANGKGISYVVEGSSKVFVDKLELEDEHLYFS